MTSATGKVREGSAYRQRFSTTGCSFSRDSTCTTGQYCSGCTSCSAVQCSAVQCSAVQCLYLAERHVLPALQLDEVFLPVHNPDCPVRHHLADVTLREEGQGQEVLGGGQEQEPAGSTHSPEPALALVVEELLLSLLRHPVVLLDSKVMEGSCVKTPYLGHMAPSYDNLPPGPLGVGHPVAALIPVHQPDVHLGRKGSGRGKKVYNCIATSAI